MHYRVFVLVSFVDLKDQESLRLVETLCVVILKHKQTLFEENVSRCIVPKSKRADKSRETLDIFGEPVAMQTKIKHSR